MDNNNKVTGKIIETEVPIGIVHSAAIEPYRVRLFVDDEIIRDRTNSRCQSERNRKNNGMIAR